jgi:hypothetical protein
VILTTEQASNLVTGSNIIVGNKGTGTSTDRGVASMRSICNNKKIESIESVEINGSTYAAVYIQNDDNTFNTAAGETYISTMPYFSGWNDNVKGTDGSRFNYTNGKEPGLLQKIEFMNGAYLIVSDELCQWGKNENGDYTFDVYTCKDQAKVTTNGTISSDYTKQNITLTFPDGTTNGWKNTGDTAIDEDTEWPCDVSAKGTGEGCRAAFYCGPAASGVRASWCFGYLRYGGIGGLACRSSDYAPSSVLWIGSVGSPGLAG